MEELLELREHIQAKRYHAALCLVDELEEMSREDKVNKVYSFSIILLLHLIKQKAENRTTRSWELSIRNASRQIARTNKRRKSGGYYLTEEGLLETLSDAYQSALESAAIEALEGRYDYQRLGAMVDRGQIEQQALALIVQEQQN